MFGNLSGAATSGLTFSKIITGISKTLGIVNQAIPIYQQAKPMIGNARNLFSIYKEFKSAPANNNVSSNSSNKTSNFKTNNFTQKKRIQNNLNPTPTFFQ